jgi:hypothetical protein
MTIILGKAIMTFDAMAGMDYHKPEPNVQTHAFGNSEAPQHERSSTIRCKLSK